MLSQYQMLLSGADYLLMLALVFFAASLTVGVLVWLFFQQGSLRTRLARFVPVEDGVSPQSDALLKKPEGGNLSRKLSEPLYKAMAPTEAEKQKKDRQLLIQAGFRSQAAYRNYMALRFVCMILFPLGFLFTVFFYKLSPLGLIIGVCLAAMGFVLPSVLLGFIAARRKLDISRALPDALDLMVVCVESGLGLDMTFKRVGEEVRPLSKALSDEFRLTTSEIRAGKPRSDSFRAMAARTDVQEVNNLMTILVQSSRFGTSMAQALRVHSDAMRVKRRLIAEEKAAKVAVKLIFPLIFFIFPALMIVIGGPAFIRIYRVLLPAMSGGG